VESALGIGASRQPTVVYSGGTANVLHAMDAHRIRKLAVISAVPAGPRAEQPFLQRHMIIPILERVFGASYDDMRRMGALLRGSDLDCTKCTRWPPTSAVNCAKEFSYRSAARQSNEPAQ
jgi:hypothetical protein